VRDAVIVDAVRTPIGKRSGSLSDTHSADLSATVLRALIERTGLDPSLIDDVIWGCVGQVGDQSLNIARVAVLSAGWPDTVPATTVDRQCGSSQQSVHFAAAGLISGQYDFVVAGGVENMTRIPMGATASSGYAGTHNEPFGPTFFTRYHRRPHQGLGAEMVAQRWTLSRQQLDAHYAAADLVVLTSRSEGIPLVLMEAMAHGKPVLAPAITGIPELVLDGQNGFLYRPGSLPAFVARVELVYHSGSALDPLGRAARQHVLQHFNREKNLAAFCNLLLMHISKPVENYSYENPVLQ